MTGHAWYLLTLLVVAVGVLIFLINGRFKMHPFLALMVVSLATALAAGEPVAKIPDSFAKGAGGVMEDVGITLALGAMLGRLLSDSGATDRIASLIIDRGNPRTIPWLMTAAAFVIGIPMFFEIGFIIMLPFIFNVAERLKRAYPEAPSPYVAIATPTIAALATLHGMVPPHPGPLTAASGLHADLGRTIVVGLICAVPTVIVAGPVYGRWLSRRMVVEPDPALVAQFTDTERVVPSGAGSGVAVGESDAGRPAPSSSVGAAVVCILVPILCMLAHSIGQVSLAKGDPLLDFLTMIGDPVIAMLLGVLVALVLLARGGGETVRRALGDSLKPIVGILLIIAAGGVFNAVLKDSGIGKAIATAAETLDVNVLVLGWVLALLLSLTTGSATVGIVSATGMVAPLLAGYADQWIPALAVVAIGAGSIGLNYVNHAGFWLVKESLGMDIGQATKLHTAVQTIVSVCGLAMVLLLSVVL
ncbi:gluconate transporter [Tsukamurella sputi]|uniref:Gluconate transporter n=1 Tax=Tsukamurella sputi TaxID=2591848 RepID=A0A5C5RTE2_9ACTN|nr:gluconate:H+ symporter [Tsukamurella sputi]TWS26357.1 gluconate transporter [Tsukamurella sputi]